MTGPARLKRRAEFLSVAAKGRKAATDGLVLQAMRTEAAGVRVGFTCSRKVGNAVSRNRARRRLKAAVQLVLPVAPSGWDLVVIGRAATIKRPFALLLEDLARALARTGVVAAA